MLELRGVKTAIEAEIRYIDPEAGRVELLVAAYDMDGNDVINLTRDEFALISRMANAHREK
jgi:hypothetical protein